MKALVVVGGLLMVAIHQSGTPGQAPSPGGQQAASEYPAGAQPAAGLPTRVPQVTASAAAEGMMAFASPSGVGQLVTVIDARRSWMAVYSVDAGGERIKLLSSRPLDQDFSVQYNIAEPTPADIKRLQSP
jgi:hypothetical protein